MKILNFGSINKDYVYSVNEFVSPGETIKTNDFKEFLGGKGLKVPIAAGVSFLIANQVPVDLVAMLFNGETSVLGQVLTAGLLSGGSKKVAETFGDIKAAVGK